MVCIFAFYEDNFSVGWHLVDKSEKLDNKLLKYFIQFYGKQNLMLRCGDFEYDEEI